MTTHAAELPADLPAGVRKGDGRLLVTQNNADKSLIINEINEELEIMLGYAKAEIVNRKLETILGQKEASRIADDLEYIDDAPDFGDMFGRVHEMRLRRRLGEEITVNCTLTRLVAADRNARFQLVVPNEGDRIRRSKIKEFISTNLEGRKELDEATGLPNYKTAKEFLPLLSQYLSQSGVSAAFAVVSLDRHKKSLARYGTEQCKILLSHAAQCCRSSFRAHDIVFAFSDHTLGLVLLDISRESTRVVLNRLRWNIRSHRIVFGGKSDFSVTVSVGFDMISPDTVEDLMDRCEASVAKLDANERNLLVELTSA